jgi:GT2 family glycosyltransferase
MQKVSIIMVNYNGVKYLGKEDLADAIKSFLETNYESYEFIFVDNNSTDESITVVKSLFQEYPQVQSKIVRNDENLGFAGGCNKGIEKAEGNYICLVNNDDKALDKDWLRELLKVVESDEKIGAVFAKKMKWSNPSEVDARGMTITPAGIVCESDIEDKIAPRLIWQTPVLFRKNLIEKIGGRFFDDDYVILHDDTDSSLRIWLAGYKILYVPTSIVLHKRSATMKQLPVEFVAFHGRKNIIQTIIKNYETKNLIKWLPINLSIYSISIFYYLIVRRFDQAKATTKALQWTVGNLKNILKKRKYVQKKVRRVTDNEIFNLMGSFDFYNLVKRRKTWPR